MNRLCKIRVRNFQSHRDSVLVLTPGVNVIHGKSTSGKTALVRALLLLKNNRPLGFRYNSNFSDAPTSIEVSTDAHTVVFDKDANHSKYIVDGLEYTGFGAGVPEEVIRALNLSEVNIAEQLDQHFLINSAPGQVAKELNKIANIDRIDTWTSKLTTKINSENKEVAILSQQRDKKIEELRRYEQVEQADECIKRIELLEVSFKRTSDNFVDLQRVCREYKQVVDELLKYQRYSNLEESLPKIEKIHTVYSKIVEDIQTLESLCLLGKKISRYSGLLDEAERVSCLFEEYKNNSLQLRIVVSLIDVSEAVEQYSYLKPIDSLLGAIGGLFVSFKEEGVNFVVLSRLVDQLRKCDADIAAAYKLYKERKEEYLVFLNTIDICPTCYGFLDSAAHERMARGVNE